MDKLKTFNNQSLLITVVTSISLIVITCIYSFNKRKIITNQQQNIDKKHQEQEKQSNQIKQQQEIKQINRTPKKSIVVLTKPTDLIQLPHSILLIIFEGLSFRDYSRSKIVNKNWNTVLNKIDRLWRGYSIDKWGYACLPLPSNEDEQIDYANHFKLKYKEEQKRLGFTPEKYIITVYEQCAEFTEQSRWKMERVICSHSWWKKRLVEEMNSSLTLSRLELSEKNSNIINQPGAILVGTILNQNSGIVIGRFRFIDTYDAKTKFESESAWIDQRTESPWTGDIVGYFNWTLFAIEERDNDLFEKDRGIVAEFLRTLTYETRGIVARIGLGVVARSILLESCKLSSVFGKYGMNDGDCLIDTDMQSNYIVTLIEDVQKFLDRKGVGYNVIEGGAKVVYTDQTSHNPIRYTGHLPKEALKLEIQLWIYNTIILSNKKLWGRKISDD